jgi:hypothetical protein
LVLPFPEPSLCVDPVPLACFAPAAALFAPGLAGSGVAFVGFLGAAAPVARAPDVEARLPEEEAPVFVVDSAGPLGFAPALSCGLDGPEDASG